MKSTHRRMLVNNELIPYRWLNGVKLVRPEDGNCFALVGFESLKYNVACLFNMGFNVYFVDKNNVIQSANESTIKVCGFNSVSDAIGNKIEKVAKKETYLFEYAHEQEVIKKNKLLIKHENYQRADGLDLAYVAFKFPWYDSQNNIIGVFGCSLPLDHSDRDLFPHALSQLVNTGLLSMAEKATSDQAVAPLTIDGVALTQREVDCIQSLLKGFTAKQIGKNLGISRRTVENYLANTKNKLNVSTKAELIEKIISHTQ